MDTCGTPWKMTWALESWPFVGRDLANEIPSYDVHPLLYIPPVENLTILNVNKLLHKIEVKRQMV